MSEENVKKSRPIKLTVTITLTLGEWRAIANRLNNGTVEYCPVGAFRGVITNAINKADVRLTEAASVSNIASVSNM